MGNLNQFFRDLGRNAYGLGENVASLGSAAIAEPVAGFAAMYDPVNGAQAIREGMTYTPRTQAGQMYQQGAARTLGTIAKPAMPVIDTWQRGVDIAGGYSPVAGAMLRTVPAAIGVAMGAKPALQAGRQVSESLGAMQARMIANANAPRTLNAGYMGQRGAIGTQRPLTEFEQAHLTAQRNAALPVEKGGLGLPADNTAMDRARAMGFDVDNPVYHGTGADFPNFQGSTTGKTRGSGVFFTENPSVASTYASSNGGSVIPAVLRTESPVQVSTNGANWNWIKKDAKVDAPRITVADTEGDELMAELFGDSSPVSIQKKAFKKTVGKLFPEDFKYDDHITTDDLARWANKEGYDSISFDSIKDRGPSGIFANAESALPSKNTAAFDPKNIRSRFAAFDPMQRQSSNLLAQSAKLVPATTLGALMANEKRKEKRN